MNHIAPIAAQLGALDGVLLTGEANCFYATGFRGEGTCLITRESAVYITDSRYTEAARKALHGAAEVVESHRDCPVSAIVNRVLGHGEKTLGFEEETMTVAQHGRFAKKIRAHLQEGASSLLTRLRGSKDEEELRRMKEAQRLAETAFLQLLTEVRPGMTEQQAAARLQYLMLSSGAEKMAFDTIVASGPHSSMPHAVPTDRAFAAGDFITLDFGCQLDGYCSDTTRTVALGAVSDEMEQVYDTVLRAQQAGIAAARAGVPGRDIDAAARGVIEAAGYGAYFGHSFGHSLGIEVHESPSPSPANEKPMPDGAVISAEPGIYLPGRFGVRIEDVLILRDTGSENITTLPKSLLCL